MYGVKSAMDTFEVKSSCYGKKSANIYGQSYGDDWQYIVISIIIEHLLIADLGLRCNATS